MLALGRAELRCGPPSADGQSVRAGAGRQATVPAAAAGASPHRRGPGDARPARTTSAQTPLNRGAVVVAKPCSSLAEARRYPQRCGYRLPAPAGRYARDGRACGGHSATLQRWRAGQRMPLASSAGGSTSRPSSGSGRANPPPRLPGATAVAASGFAPRPVPAPGPAPPLRWRASPSHRQVIGTLVPGRGGSASGRNPLHGSTRGGFNGCR